ncbi:MAG: cell wall hydrolase [Azospirillum sp.]|nr:cell wall hydrolase [Azospirillum sp.]
MAAGRGTPALGGTREDAIETLARTLWGEARGEPVRGIEAVAAVVLNRVAVARRQGGFWWGNSIVEVCRKPWQFSCWNPDDVNRPKMLAVKTGEPMFDVCLRVARRAVAGLIADPTLGATHYHHRSVHPEWAKGRAPSAVIGVHLFYNDAG